MMTDQEFCRACGQLNNEAVTDGLWNVYGRLRDGRQHREPLVFDGEWMQENVRDEEDFDVVMGAMGRDMANRGLCTECGRPDLRGVNPDDVMSEDDAQDLAEMYAEQAAERRAGC